MSREIECPGCGLRIPLDERPAPSEPDELPAIAENDIGRTIETLIPATVSLDDEGRHQMDEAGVAMAAPSASEPFGVYVAGDSESSGESVPASSGSHSSANGQERDVSDPELDVRALDLKPPAPNPLESGSNDLLKPASPDPVLDVLEHHPRPESSAPADSFLAQFSPAEPAPAPFAGPAPPAPETPAPVFSPSDPATTGTENPRTQQQETAEDVDEEDEEDYEGRSIGSILLASYASALTLALIWLIWTGRVWQGPSGPPSIPSDSLESVESGAYLQNLPKLDIDHRTKLGNPLRLGDLEITPLAVEARDEKLVTFNGNRSAAEPGTLTIRLRLRNLSDSAAFTPIDSEFVRAPDRGLPESVLIAGDEPIFPYPLALQSERSIEGQDFDPLEPGAERELIVVSAPGAVDRLAPSMTWRLRVRTAPEQTDTIGIDFQKGDVRL